MGPAAFYVLALLLAAIVLLALERLPLSVIGVGLVVGVAIPGLLTGSEAVAGFANPAIVTVAALYVVGEAFLRTGAAALLAERMLHGTGGSETRIVLLLMAVAAVTSAFVNNTLVVITMLPVVLTVCQRSGLLPSRLLIPLSYASIFGGVCTLVGTSTNLLVSGVLQQAGHPRLGMFESTPIGVLIAGGGVLFLALVGRRLLPRIPSLTGQMGGSKVREYVTEITVGAGSPLLGQPVGNPAPGGDKPLRPLALVRDEAMHWPPFRNLQVAPGDILVLRGGLQDLARLQQSGLGAFAGTDEFDPGSMSFFELAVAPGSPAIGQRIGRLGLKARHGAVVAAVLRGGRHLRERIADLRLGSGDVLLVFGDDRSRERLRQRHDFLLLEGVEETLFAREKAGTAFAVIGAMLALFVSGVVEPPIAALLGAMGMVLCGCVSIQNALRSVDWQVILFLGGILALGQALVATGATASIAAALAPVLVEHGPAAGAVLLLVVAGLLSEFLSNNAVAVMMTPVALAIASQTGADPRPLALAVLFGSSAGFANPMSYKTHLIVLGPGGYRFRDFVLVGMPTNLLYLALASLGIWLASA